MKITLSALLVSSLKAWPRLRLGADAGHNTTGHALSANEVGAKRNKLLTQGLLRACIPCRSLPPVRARAQTSKESLGWAPNVNLPTLGQWHCCCEFHASRVASETPDHHLLSACPVCSGRAESLRQAKAASMRLGSILDES